MNFRLPIADCRLRLFFGDERRGASEIENRKSKIENRSQAGYALVALLALMTILMLAVVAVAPSIRQQQQRERELESIRRGEEVAEAIRLYHLYTKAFPTSMEQLLKGVTPPGKIKNLMILRAEAAHDPLSKSGEWRFVRPNDPTFRLFQKALIKYAGTPPPTTDSSLGQPPALPVLGLEGLNKTSDDKDTPPGDEDDTPNTSIGQFIGVVSRSRRASVVTYYGIARHDRWVFTPFYR